jgi:protein-S-isoprenylcysteine O-methyltransferase Ste14
LLATFRDSHFFIVHRPGSGRHVGAFVTVSAKLITALPVVMIAGWMAMRREGPWDLMRFLSLVLVAAALVGLVVARIQFEKECPHSGLVTRGVYSRIRHPVYLFSLFAFLGLLLYLHEPEGIVLLLPVELVLFYRARREEQELAALYGDKYQCYRQQTWF